MKRVVSVVLCSLVLSCSLSKFDQKGCESHQQCRDAFGYGFVCGNGGFCEVVGEYRRCDATFPSDLLVAQEQYADAIVFGTLMDRSEPKKVARERSMRLAAKQAESLEGRTLALVSCDVQEDSSNTTEEAAVDAARYLAEELEVVGILGPSGSGATKAVYEAVRDTGVIVISPSATSPELTDLDPSTVSDAEPGRLWRTAPPDSLQGEAIADDMIARGVTEVTVVHSTDAYGEGLANVFRRAFEEDGNVAHPVPWENTSELSEAIPIGATYGGTEVLFISSARDDIVTFLNEAARPGGYDGKGFFLPDAAASADVFVDVTSEVFSRIRGTRVRAPDDLIAYSAFSAAYRREYDEEVSQFSYTAQSYDAAWLAFYGSAWALANGLPLDGSAVAQGLRKISCQTDGSTTPCATAIIDVIPSGWTKVQREFESGNAVEISGASGPLNYRLVDEETSGDIEVWTVDASGEIVAVVEGDEAEEPTE